MSCNNDVMCEVPDLTFGRDRYGIILWGGTRESIKVLRIQKKVIRLVTGIKNMNSVDTDLKKIEFLW